MNGYARLGLESLTYAMQARDILNKRGIQSNAVRLQAGESSGGCAYGIELSRRDIMAASSLLRLAGIEYKQLN